MTMSKMPRILSKNQMILENVKIITKSRNLKIMPIKLIGKFSKYFMPKILQNRDVSKDAAL